jgi:hypothetical protein
MPELLLELPHALGRPVAIAGWSLLCPAGIGAAGLGAPSGAEVPGFRARDFVEDRKSLKLMTRAVQLGVSAVGAALRMVPEASRVPPERRGIYVGASPQPGEPEDLRPALAAASDAEGAFDLTRFAIHGIPRIYPLWLVRGLSNNVLGYASAIHDCQGSNSNYCDGEEGGWTAIVEGAAAVAEGRADLVVAGGADCLVGGDTVLGQPCAEGAAFLVLRPAVEVGPFLQLDRDRLRGELRGMGHMGAATWPVAIARAGLRGLTSM